MITIDFTKLVKAGNKPGEYQGVCPVCGQRKFYINLYSKKYICFRESCGIRGSIAEKDESFYIEKPTFDDLDSIVKGLFVRENPIVEIDLDEFSDPLVFRNYPIAYAYIRERRFTDDDIRNLSLRVGKEYYDKDDKLVRKWKGRVIFPFFDNGVPVYAIGRSYIGQIPKYLNTKAAKSVILYNKDNIKDKVIVCEGLISALAAQRETKITAVPLLGTNLSQYQSFLLSRAREIYISLDGGVNVDKLVKSLSVYDCKLYKVELPEGKDPDEVGTDYMKYFENARRIEDGIASI